MEKLTALGQRLRRGGFTGQCFEPADDRALDHPGIEPDEVLATLLGIVPGRRRCQVNSGEFAEPCFAPGQPTSADVALHSALVLEQLSEQFKRGGLVAPLLNQGIEDLALSTARHMYNRFSLNPTTISSRCQTLSARSRPPTDVACERQA